MKVWIKRLSEFAIKRAAKKTPNLHVCDVWPARCSENWGFWTGDPETRHKGPNCAKCLTLAQMAENIEGIDAMERRMQRRRSKEEGGGKARAEFP